MIDNKKKIIIVIIVLVIAIVAIIVKNNNKTEVEETPSFKGDLEILETEAIESEQIKNVFSEVEESYQAGVLAYSGYTRGDFYNETRLNMNMEAGQVSFVNEEDIDTENLYDVLGNKIDTLPNPQMNGNDVEISEANIIEDENYYLLRCTSNSAYIYYYIVRITTGGLLEMEWYCYTENEIIDNDFDSDLYTDVDQEDLDDIDIELDE